ncbi:C-type lectin domain family 4 member M-like isoform X2 [Triplophysa dalaica]|nr:C-type lectin domain family 4 member M-like isoform X2 [Triplophysa dalaica]
MDRERVEMMVEIYESADDFRTQTDSNTNRQQSLQCTDGWIYYKFSLYFISSEKKNWTESRRYCRERGADLIIINNKEEQDFIEKKTCKERFWIGLSDSDEEGRWKWVDGSAMTSGFSFWKSGEPNGRTKENCVESAALVWNDLNCHVTRKWICERIF